MENQNVTEPVTEQEQGRTFTQEQVNAIVGKRLAEQKATMESDFVKREDELNKREMGIRAKELLAEKGLPKELADVLRYDSEEELAKAIDTIEHTRGFKGEEQGKGDLRIIENRLPRGLNYEPADPIADAFKRKDS